MAYILKGNDKYHYQIYGRERDTRHNNRLSIAVSMLFPAECVYCSLFDVWDDGANTFCPARLMSEILRRATTRTLCHSTVSYSTTYLIDLRD